LAKKKEIGMFKPGNVMSPIWQGKASLDFVETTKEAPVQIAPVVPPTIQSTTSAVVVQDSTAPKKISLPVKEVVLAPKIVVGEVVQQFSAGPCLNLKPIPAVMQYTANFLSSFMAETQDHGVVLLPDIEMMSRYKKVELASLQSVVAQIERGRASLFETKVSCSGLPFQDRLLQILSTLPIEQLYKLNTFVQTAVLKTSTPASPTESTMAKMVDDTSVPVHVSQKKFTVKAKVDGKEVNVWRAYHSWVGPFATQVNLAAAQKIKKDSHPLLKELAWVNQVSSSLGASAISELTAGMGLMPGLSKAEAATIRFITVAIYYLETQGKIAVSAGVTALSLLYTTVMKLWAKKENKLETWKSSVTLVPWNLKNSALTSLKSIYRVSTSSTGSFLVAWMPKAFTTMATFKEIVENNEQHYSDITEYTSRAVFREVLEPNPKLFYYADGFPDPLTCWESTHQVSAMAYKPSTTLWGVENLQEIQQATFFTFMLKASMQRLRHPFAPVVTRSYRVTAVHGHERMNFSTVDGEDVFDLGSVIMEEDYPVLSQHDPQVQSADNSSPPPPPDKEQIAEEEAPATFEDDGDGPF